MYIYIVTFITSLLFLYLGLKYKSNKYLYIIFTLIGLCIPCFLAAVRDYSIGTDVITYQLPYFTKAKVYPSLFRFIIDLSFHNVYLSSKEILYLVLSWICNHMFNSFSAFLFFTQFLIITPIYISLKKMAKSNSDIILGMFIYFTYFYNLTYNVARQSIALAFTILAFVFLEKKEYKKAILTAVVALFFHNTAIILFPIILLYCFLNSKHSSKSKILVQILVILLLTLLAIFFVPIITWLGESFNIRYGEYATVWLKSGESIIGKKVFLKTIFLILFTIYYKKRFKTETSNYSFYLYILFIYLLSSYTNALIEHSNRIYYYLIYPYIFILIPRFPNTFDTKRTKFFVTCIIIAFFSIYWYYIYCYLGYNHTVPYLFKK